VHEPCDALDIVDLSTILMDMSINIQRPAVLAMDLQTDILGRFPHAQTVLEPSAAVLAAARAAHVPVIYVAVGFRPGYPEIDPGHPTFGAVAKSGRMIDPTAADIAPAVRPHDGDVLVVKRRVGAFSGTDLEIVLRAKRIDTLVLFGLATSGVVLSTVRHAADADYRIVVVRDACADADEEVHRVLLDKVIARQATVVSSSDAIAALRAAT
jgi:nicotinamidase-related amidase